MARLPENIILVVYNYNRGRSIMKLVRDIRRAGVVLEKRVRLFKYNAQVRFQRGQGYDIEADTEMMD
jgi:hypothetical protein